jgi:protein-S-isoprenylcysteine O-methyltransferase Ste14
MQNNISRDHSITPEERRRIVLWIVQSILGVIGYGVVLFLSAGRLDWVWGWCLLGLLAAFLAGHVLILMPISPALLAEREKGLRDKEAKPWDRWVAAISGGVLPLASWVMAGLNLRFGWTRAMSLTLQLGGLIISALGYGLFLWAMGSNAFFTETVRIQPERGHVVATGGPYRFVRHPGYTGAILSFLATPFLLGSWWALIPAGLGISGYILRTAREDRTLQADLQGYGDYTQQVRYRLLPGIW